MTKFVRIPKRGDIAVNELAADTLGNHKTGYIPLEQYKAADIAGTHEVIGVVAGIIGREALIVHPDCGTKAKFTDRLWWYCSGYILDGASHTITFSLYFASNSYASAITKTVSYSATTLSSLISTLNTAFAADSDFTAQEWYADEYEKKLRLTCENLEYNQSANNSASGGLSMGICMPEIKSRNYMRRKNGNNSYSGAISSMERALLYYKSSTGTNSYEGGRTTEQDSVKQTYPINLTTWNSTSPDYCAYLRSIYGDGEEGWKRFMKSCLPITPTDYGLMGLHDGKSICNQLAQITGRKMSSADSVQLMAAFAKPYNLMGNTFSKGDFWLSTPEEILVILEGTNTSDDPLNLGLVAIGGNPILYISSILSCLRNGNGSVCVTDGNFGFFGNYGMNSRYIVAPVSRSVI